MNNISGMREYNLLRISKSLSKSEKYFPLLTHFTNHDYRFSNVSEFSILCLNYHRMTDVGLRVLPLSTTINVLAICPSSVAGVWTLYLQSPYELSQNDHRWHSSSSFINHN